MNPDWHAALAYALTGERLPVAPAQTPDEARLLADLAALGWNRERLAATAREARRVPAELMTGLGAAQFWAVLAGIRRDLAANGTVQRPPSRRTQLDADEQRLSADRPPHW